MSTQQTVSRIYCTAYNSSSSTASPSDPPLPTLPDQYQTVIEANIVDRNFTATAYEYFDNPGDRAVLRILQNNSVNSLVFDYAHDQLFYVINNVCTVADLKSDSNNVLFGNKVVNGIPHVFTTGGALHFAKSLGEKYMGPEVVRGIMCNKWRSCMYWPQLNSNFTLDYYFTVPNWTDPVNYPQIPVRALAQGVQVQGDGSLRNFTHYYDYVNFKPVLPDDLSVFETPKGVVCPDRVQTRQLPTLPSFYHYRQEIIKDADNKVFQADVWYDHEYRYIRYDYKPASAEPPLYTTDPLTEIHDYNYGVRYVKDQVTGICHSMSLANNSFDVAENATIFNYNGSYSIHMKDPMQLFYLKSRYAYTGQRMARGLQCDVFTALVKDYYVPNFGKTIATFEYYFLADGWKEYPDDGSTTPSDVPVYLEVTVPNIGYKTRYNFVDFDEEHPDTSIFDISSCFSESSKLQFSIRFPGSYKTGTAGQIKVSAQRLFRDVMNVRPLRVQDVRLDYDNSQIYISATLIDRSPFLAQFTFLSSKEIRLQDDKTFPSSMANNISTCAQLCVTNTGFTCNSYDFCPLDTDHTCRLSKAHIGDGKAVLVNSSCDHFSRTVDGPPRQELSILEAYNNLKQQVYNQGVEIDAYINGLKDPVKYIAVDIAVTFGWLTPKQVPGLQGQFSYHLEMTQPKFRAVYNSHIYYDSDYKLVRYDMVNTKPSPPQFSVHPQSTIHDYNSGLAYTLDKQEGNCSIAPLANTSFDTSFSDNAGFVIQMKSPLDLFYLNGSYKYAGQRTIRGMLCDVFETYRTDFKLSNNPIPFKSVFQFYFMSSDWNEMSEDSGTTVNSQPIALVISSATGGFTVTYNFFDFSEQQPDLSNFDIRPCYAGNQQRHFLIKFKGSYHPTMDTKLKVFTKNLQTRLMFLTGASFLRFQEPEITYSDDAYIYYLATMVEQAPYLLDFTKTSNNVAIYPADKTIDNVRSDSLCAAYCRNETIFVCQGFDYCPTAKKCQLSRAHNVQSGTSTRPSQTCDHYSKTVNNVAPIELTVDEAFIILKDAVYTNVLNVSVHNDDGSMSAANFLGQDTYLTLLLFNENTIYSAVLFDQDIVRPDTTATTGANLKHFIPAREKVIISKVDIQLRGLSVDQCAARCLTEPTIDCQSFDFCFDTAICILSRLHPSQNLSLVTVHANCNLYARTYLDDYTAYPGQALQNNGDIAINNVYSADFCARKCNSNTDFPCKSIDYCPTTKTCMLRSVHILDVPKSAINTKSFCTHYSRKYLTDFQRSPGKSLLSGKSLTFTNVSNQACAKLCAENSGVQCLAFTYCSTTTSCVILSVSPAQNRASITSVPTCDLYTRAYFPPQPSYPSSHGSPGHPSSGHPNTGPGSTNGNNANGTNGPLKQTGSQADTGYSGGAMAGLAIGMLIPGMVLGAGLLYFMRTKRLVQEEQMRMGFVNMNHDNEDTNYANVKTITTDDDMPQAHLHDYDTPSSQT